jgi:predicted alpha/beta hydrolase family esterase
MTIFAYRNGAGIIPSSPNGSDPGTKLTIGGALLVAVPDPEAPGFPPQARGFAPVSRVRLDCPSIVVASIDDPYGDLPFVQRCARSWGSRLVNIGKAGHINAASGLGEWSEGHRLLASLGRRTRG